MADQIEELVPLGDGFLPSRPRPAPRGLGLGEPLKASNQDRLVVTDSFVRGNRVLGRFQRIPAMLGLRCTERLGVVRMTVSLALDAQTESWWRDRLGIGSSGRRRVESDPMGPLISKQHPEGPPTFDESARTRLVRVSAPGAPDAFALIAPRTARGTDVTYGFAVIHLPDSSDGFAAIEISDATRTAEVRKLGVTRCSAVGLLLDEILLQEPEAPPVDSGTIIDPLAAERAGFVSTGAAGMHAGPGPRRLYSSALVINARSPRPAAVLLRSSVEGESDPTNEFLAYVRTHSTLSSLDNSEAVALDVQPGADVLSVPLGTDGGAMLLRVPAVDERGYPITWHFQGLRLR